MTQPKPKRHIYRLGLDNRTAAALKYNNIWYIEDLLNFTVEELLDMRLIGKTAIDKIQQQLGLCLYPLLSNKNTK